MTPPEQALTELRDIHRWMDRARVYRHLCPSSAFFAGGAALAGSIVMARASVTSAESPALFLALWSTIFVFSLGFQVHVTIKRTRWLGEPVWSSLAREIAQGLWPSLLAGVALTVLFLDRGVPELVPLAWVLCYGVGALAAARHRREVGWLGGAFLASGVLFVVAPLPEWLILGSTFGLHHVLFGVLLTWRRAA